MRISAIREDNTVYVDGVPRTVAWSSVMPNGWYAVQWDGTTGHIEFDGPVRNQPITDPSLAMLCKTAWDNGTPLGHIDAPTSDVVAAARAAVLDQLIVTQAAAPDADPLLVEAAAKIVEVQKANDALAALAEVTPGG